MKNISVQELKEHAKELRKTALTMIYEAQSGHPGGAFSSAEITAALYYGEMNIDPKNPKWPDRDRYILSKGHACPIQYAALGLLGYFPEEKLHTLRQEGSILQGHPDMKKCPGIDISTGSLGQGFACGAGMALAAKRRGEDWRVFVVLGDGELDEGAVWEAAASAVKFGLDNLTAIVDWNKVQLDGTTDEIMPLRDLPGKWKAFGWNVLRCDGHDLAALDAALDAAVACKGVPTVILADTIKGKGVSFMEGKSAWHGKAIPDAEFAQAMQELGGNV